MDKTVMNRKLFMGGLDPKVEAETFATDIRFKGGLAIVEAEYGSDMGQDNVFWGWAVKYFSPEQVAEAARIGASPVDVKMVI